MRPDKKKVRHHDSRKSEQKAKERIAKEAKTNQDKLKGKEKQVTLNHEEDESTESKISSNWAKYEISSGSEDEGFGATGLDFNDVLNNSSGSSSHFRTKFEKEWEKSQTTFTSEFFSLDIKNLEKAISCIPLHEWLDIDRNDMSEADYKAFCQNAHEAQNRYETSFLNDEVKVKKVVENPHVSQGMSSLNITDKTQPEQPAVVAAAEKVPPKDEEASELEAWLDEYLSD